MAVQIGAALAGASGRRTFAPVRRNSRLRGRCELGVWAPITRKQVRAILLAAKRFERMARPAGQRNGPLGPVALELLELLGNTVDFRTGRLEPSLAWLMERLRRSRSAICAALVRLRDNGFIGWVRRYVPTGEQGVRGPQVAQTSNAYRLGLPEHVRPILGRYGEAPPLPDDIAQQRDMDEAQREAWIAALSLEEQMHVRVGDPALARALASLARAFDTRQQAQERESAEQTESPSRSIYNRQTHPLPPH